MVVLNLPIFSKLVWVFKDVMWLVPRPSIFNDLKAPHVLINNG